MFRASLRPSSGGQTAFHYVSSNLLYTVHTACHPTLKHHNSYNRTENHRPWNAVWPPDDGRKDARNMLRNNWLPIKSLIVASSWSHLYLQIFTYFQLAAENKSLRKLESLMHHGSNRPLSFVYIKGERKTIWRNQFCLVRKELRAVCHGSRTAFMCNISLIFVSFFYLILLWHLSSQWLFLHVRYS